MSYSSLVSDFLVAKCKLHNTERMREANGIASEMLTTFLAKIRHPGDGVKVCVHTKFCLLACIC